MPPTDLFVEMKKLPRADLLSIHKGLESHSQTIYLYPSMPSRSIRDVLLNKPEHSINELLDLGFAKVSVRGKANVFKARFYTLLATRSTLTLGFLMLQEQNPRICMYVHSDRHVYQHKVFGVQALVINSSSKESLCLISTNPFTVEIVGERYLKVTIKLPSIALLTKYLSFPLALRMLQFLSNLQHSGKCSELEIRDPCTILLSCSSDKEFLTLELWNACSHTMNSFLCIRSNEISRLKVNNELGLTVGKRCVRIPLASNDVVSVIVEIG